MLSAAMIDGRICLSGISTGQEYLNRMCLKHFVTFTNISGRRRLLRNICSTRLPYPHPKLVKILAPIFSPLNFCNSIQAAQFSPLTFFKCCHLYGGSVSMCYTLRLEVQWMGVTLLFDQGTIMCRIRNPNYRIKTVVRQPQIHGPPLGLVLY